MAFMESQISPQTIRSFLPSSLAERYWRAKPPGARRKGFAKGPAIFLRLSNLLFCRRDGLALPNLGCTPWLAQALILQDAGFPILATTVAS
jgi:hypothetical protein